LLFDPTVVRRLGGQLFERRTQTFGRLPATTTATVNETDVGHDLTFGLLIVELPEERKGAPEVRERRVVVAATGHSQRQAIQGQCLSSLVAELADYLERLAVVVDRRSDIPAPPFGCASGVQASCLPPAPGKASAKLGPRASEIPESGA